MTKYRGYAAIRKVTDNDDGTVTVEGIASDGAVDLAGEIVAPEAMKAALPDFMKYGTGALREMHQPMAAGTVNVADVNDAGETIIQARVVDPVAVLKVKEGVYKGFSIGGSSTSRLGKTITGLRLTEISLVDAPCNPNAVIQVWKAEVSEEGMSQEQVHDELAALVEKSGISAGDLVALIKKAAAPAAEPVDVAEASPAAKQVEKAEPVIAKGIYSVGDFANVLRDIFWMASDAQDEANWEGDDSPVPAQLREWLKTGAEIFNAMAAEESAELVASLGKAREQGNIGKAEAAPAPTALSADAEPVAKAMELPGADIVKSLQEQVSKMAGQFEAVTKAHESLQADHAALVEKFNKMPTEPKAVIAVEKGADAVVTSAQQEVEPVRKADGSIDEHATAFKKVYAAGGFAISK
ncbi:hypothetical protein KIF53_15380 [Chromobacterium subtsugae]|uniref:Uncharacterized protein n=1 Tax=Chromobacterium subtsugae TaxID=251747 RepID=A0ABS7FIA3_9NEIS|nr:MULTISPECIES: hypothetical protein [Chromobacterium]MBW7567788.1 hypothetical protein [Chromobacterium subtsugae]MBW8289014.1 hypothetical protein [Chromobacterium subtsugae]WSE93841.1 hypothetical protein U6115_11515 [Chromobacterium subtsugae]WVH62218.1 hypothetical protein U6151_11535 [Chromobacterium subtsugae]